MFSKQPILPEVSDENLWVQIDGLGPSEPVHSTFIGPPMDVQPTPDQRSALVSVRLPTDASKDDILNLLQTIKAYVDSCWPYLTDPHAFDELKQDFAEFKFIVKGERLEFECIGAES